MSVAVMKILTFVGYAASQNVEKSGGGNDIQKRHDMGPRKVSRRNHLAEATRCYQITNQR